MYKNRSHNIVEISAYFKTRVGFIGQVVGL